jgi:lactate racemase
MHINIPYGTKGVSFELPDEEVWQLLFPYPEKPIDDLKHRIIKYLEHPVSHTSLSEIIHSGYTPPHRLKTVIICDDTTHPVSQKQVLDVIIPYIQSHGVLLSNTRIIMATGNNRHLGRDEFFARFGSWMSPVLIENHSPLEGTVRIGKFFNGEDVLVNKAIADADLIISVSSVVPNPFSGFTGGSMLVVPGLAGSKTIGDYFKLYYENPQIKTGQYLNVLRGMSDQATDLLKIDFSVHLVLNALDGICNIFCGDHMESFLKAAEYSYRISKVRIRTGADVVIAGSYPADIDLWQVFQTFLTIAPIVRDGGIVVLIAPCPEGTKNYASLPGYIGSSEEEILKTLRNDKLTDKPVAAVAYRIAKELARVKLCIISEGIRPEDAGKMNVSIFSNIHESLQYCRKKLGNKIRISLVPYGGKVIPHKESPDEINDPMRTRWME